jgi:hypothetical protein
MIGWGSIRVLISLSRQTIKYYISYKRRTSALKGYNHEKSEKRQYYKKDNYKLSISVSRANKLTNLLPHNKRNKIIFKPPPDNH